MAIKNAATSPPVQRLIGWYDHEIAIAEGDPVSQWPWAFGQFSDGTPIAAAHRFLYREHPDLQAAYPDPYDADCRQGDLHPLVQQRGQVALSQAAVRERAAFPLPRARCAAPCPLGAATRLLGLMFLPKTGKALRAKLAGIVRSEGIGGVARRLHSRR